MEPLVSALIELRNAARARHDFTAADALRDQSAAAGVEVRDGPDGSVWSLTRCDAAH
ncbi:MAG: CysS/YqeB C-terminal domain-containing protein [Pseudonocardia sp.]